MHASRRAMQVQEGAREIFVNSTTGMEVLLRSLLGDIVAVKEQAAHACCAREPISVLASGRVLGSQSLLRTAARP